MTVETETIGTLMSDSTVRRNRLRPRSAPDPLLVTAHDKAPAPPHPMRRRFPLLLHRSRRYGHLRASGRSSLRGMPIWWSHRHSVQSNGNWRAAVVNPDLQYRVHLVVAHKAHGFLNWVMEFSDHGQRAYSRSDPLKNRAHPQFHRVYSSADRQAADRVLRDCKNGEVKRSSA